MPKNAYFLEKGYKIATASGGSAPELPLASGGWRLRANVIYYSHQTLKKMINIWPHLEFFRPLAVLSWLRSRRFTI